MTKCAFPECKSKAKKRTLCTQHYNYAQSLIVRGVISKNDFQKAFPQTEREAKFKAWIVTEIHNRTSESDLLEDKII